MKTTLHRMMVGASLTVGAINFVLAALVGCSEQSNESGRGPPPIVPAEQSVVEERDEPEIASGFAGAEELVFEIGPGWGPLTITLFRTQDGTYGGERVEVRRRGIATSDLDSKRAITVGMPVSDLDTGLYEWEIYPIRCFGLFRIPGSVLDQVVEIGAPCMVTVHVADSDTGAPIDIESVDWRCIPPEGITVSSLGRAIRTDVPGSYSFTSPKRRVEVFATDPRYKRVRTEITPLEGNQTLVVLELTRACVIHINLEVNGARIPWSGVRDDVEVTRVGFFSSRVDYDLLERNEMGAYVLLSEAGRYEIRYECMSRDYVAVSPAVEVAVGDQETKEVVIELTRRSP